MPAPSESLTTLRPDLGGSFEDFDLAMDRLGFIGQRVLRPIEVARASGTFGRIPLKQLLQTSSVNRTSRAGYPRGDWQFEEESFATKEYGFEEPVDNRDSALYADFFDAEMVSAELARDTVLRAAEKRVADAIFNTTTWSGGSLTTGITDEWDDFENAIPIDDVNAAVKKVYDGTGLWANALIINRRVFRNLRNCIQIMDVIASQGAGSPIKAADITTSQLAQVFDLPYILVAGSSRNGANDGQNAAPTQIWSDEYAMVARIAETDNVKEPCVGRMFHWSEDGSAIGGTMESYESAEVRGTVIRCRHEVQEKVIYAACGHLLSNVTT